MEFLSTARRLDGKERPEEFAAVEALGWEMAMWLPDDIYRAAVKSLIPGDAEPPPADWEGNDPRMAVIAVRKILLGEDGSGSLGWWEVAMHTEEMDTQ
ncbi:MAG: hypothetical protein GY926_27380 [bacterium]|nr:hypothetical protein [bacterium]